MMNKKLKRKWINALRGGNYSQCLRYLTETVGGENRHCALGVLADVAGLQVRYGNQEEEEKIYPRLRELLTCDLEDIYRLNDTQMMSFNQIADWIEAHL